MAQYAVIPARHSVFLISAGCLSYSLVQKPQKESLRALGLSKQ